MENIQRDLLLKRLRDKRTAMRGNRAKASNVRPLENYSVVDTIKELLKDKNTMSVPRLNVKYVQLRQEHEPLYNMVLERDISEQELKLLENMITKRENMRDGAISEDLARDQVATHAAELFAPHLLHPSGKSPVVQELEPVVQELEPVVQELEPVVQE
jgi:hypothetical protein